VQVLTQIDYVVLSNQIGVLGGLLDQRPASNLEKLRALIATSGSSKQQAGYISPPRLTSTYQSMLPQWLPAHLHPAYLVHASEANQVVSPLPSHTQHSPSAREPLARSDSAPAARSTKTYEPSEVRERYTWDVDIPWEDSSGRRALKTAVALLDTQSQGGNWITCEFLAKINKGELVSHSDIHPQAPVVETASGFMRAVGTIKIQMKRLEGNKYFEVDFNVSPPKQSSGYEIIFGGDFLNEHDILSVNRDALLPLLVSDKLTPGT
jgi:hypothetical protein